MNDFSSIMQILTGSEHRRISMESILSSLELPFLKINVISDGINFVLVPDGPIKMVLQAHHDRVLNSPGANDNGAAVTQLMLAAKRVWTPESNVLIAWTDYEEPENCYREGCRMGEGGFVLSKWVENLNSPLHVIAFDVTGHGDTINISKFYGDVATNNLIFKTANSMNIPVSFEPTPPSDNIAWGYHRANLISTLKSEEVQSGKRKGWKVLHSPQDNMDQIEESTMDMMVEFTAKLMSFVD